MNAFTNISFRPGTDGEKEDDDIPNHDEWYAKQLAKHTATVAAVAAKADDDYVTAEELAAHSHVVGDSMFSEYAAWRRSVDVRYAEMREVKRDCWGSLKKWVCVANGLL